MMINELLDHIKHNGVAGTGIFVELCAAPDKVPFYEKLGFDYDEDKCMKMMCRAVK